MRTFLSTTYLITIFAILPVSKAFADVTTQNVWNGLRSFITSTGFELTATETQNDGVLQLNNLFFSKSLHNKHFDQSLKFSLSFSSLRFTQNDNGTVNILLPKEIKIHILGQSITKKGLDLEVNYSQKNPKITVSGKSEELFYNYTTDAGRLELGKLKINGIDFSHFDLFAHADLNKLNLTSAAAKHISYDLIQTLTFDKISYFAGMKMTDSLMNLSGEIFNFHMSNHIELLLRSNGKKTADLLTTGSSFDTNWKYGGKRFNFSSKEIEKNGRYMHEASVGTGKLKLNQKSLNLFLESTKTDLSLSHDDLPFPIALKLKKLSTNISLPLAANIKAEPFSVGIELSDFTMSEVLWSLFDKDRVLPRTPISAILDAYGRTKILMSDLKSVILNNLTAQGSFPIELENLTLEKFYLSGASATVNSSGTFEFDSSDLLTSRGLLSPIGQLEIKVQGGDTLLDRLIEINLIPKAQAIGIQMMLSIFAVPGDLDDELKALLEFTEDGHILANGQRIR